MWIPKQAWIDTVEQIRYLRAENKRLLNLHLRVRDDVARAAVEGEDLIEASREEQRARISRPGNGGGRVSRGTQADPRELDLNLEYDETQDIGGPY